MNSYSSNSVNTDTATINSFTSKIRRLKIQESVLTANVNKCNLPNCDENDRRSIYNNDIQLKQYLSKVKDSFREIRNLFDEITMKTTDQESLENTDIDELKKDILELETKIKSVKHFITNELQALRNAEISLSEMDITSEMSTDDRKVWSHNVAQMREFKEIVPSPVRVMIHSPFKCSEVQQFQDFMKNSPNRYGGWNEYNHNIFVQIWHKYYEDNMVIAMKSVVNTFTYHDFREEVLHKIPGCSLDSIDLHSNWYSDYVHLKINQQIALNKWKENKRKIKTNRKVRQVADSTKDDKNFRTNIKLCRKQQRCSSNSRNINQRNRTFSGTDKIGECTTSTSMLRNETLTPSQDSNNEDVNNFEEVQRITQKIDVSRLMRPTKQWLTKKESPKEVYKYVNCIESVTKLRIPNWRLNLRE